MSEVIPLRKEPEPEPLIWVCKCGCSSFEVYSDGTSKCGLCGHPQTFDGGAWDLPGTDIRRPEGSENRIRQCSGNGSSEFTRRVTMRRFQEEDTCFAVVLKSNGVIHCWGSIEDQEILDWVEERLSHVKSMLEPGV